MNTAQDHPQRRVVIIKAPNSQPPYPLSKRDGLLRRKDSCDGVSPAASVPADRARAWHTPAGHLARSASNPSWYEGLGRVQAGLVGRGLGGGVHVAHERRLE